MVAWYASALLLSSHRLMEIRSRLPGFDKVISPLKPVCLRSKGMTSFSSIWAKSVAMLSDFTRKWALRANIFDLSS